MRGQEYFRWIPGFSDVESGVLEDVVHKPQKQRVDVLVAYATARVHEKLQSVEQLEGERYGLVGAQRTKMRQDFQFSP